MTQLEEREHDARIVDQFTRQANPFADLLAHSPHEMLELIVRTSALEPQHEVLDVACGPGLVAVALARGAERVIGVDMVPAMLERARLEAHKAGCANLSFKQADARALPFDEGAFDRVVTRFSFHHFQDPEEVLREMARVTKPGGLLVVIDSTPPLDKRATYDEMERLRDPSHVSALTRDELERMFVSTGLSHVGTTPFALRMDLEEQLAAAFPADGGREGVRALFERDLTEGTDRMGLSPRRKDGSVRFTYLCSIVVGRR